MSNPIENLREIEILFTENKHDNHIISELLTRLQSYEHQPECAQHSSLMSSLITSATKQQLENSNFITDGWKNHTHVTETGGENKINAVRSTLQCLLSIDMNQAEIGKMFNVSRWTVGRWIKERNLSNVLIDPEDDSVIEHHLQEVLSTCPNLGELCARGVSLSKGTKINRNRLRIILKRVKPSHSVPMATTLQRT